MKTFTYDIFGKLLLTVPKYVVYYIRKWLADYYKECQQERMINMFNDVFEELNKVFDEVSKGALEAQKKARGLIALNVKKNNDGYVVEASIPGIKKEDISMNYDDSKLTIEVKEHEASKDEYVIRERFENYYKREIELANVDAEGIKARLENGILTINLPFVKKETKSICIE